MVSRARNCWFRGASSHRIKGRPAAWRLGSASAASDSSYRGIKEADVCHSVAALGRNPMGCFSKSHCRSPVVLLRRPARQGELF